jgi:hypothetical protein
LTGHPEEKAMEAIKTVHASNDGGRPSTLSIPALRTRPSSHAPQNKKNHTEKPLFVLAALLAVLSITCSFGGLLPGGATGKGSDAIFAIEPGGSVDTNGRVVDARYVFASTDPQMEVVVQAGNLSSPAALTITWYQVTDAGDQKLFTHTVQLSALERAYSIGKSAGTLAEGDYKIVAAVNGQTLQIELSVAQPTPGQVQSQSQAAKTAGAPSGPAQPPVDGGSGKTASAAAAWVPGNRPPTGGCQATLMTGMLSNQFDYASIINLVAETLCPQSVDVTGTVDGTYHLVGSIHGIGRAQLPTDPCTLPGGKDLPGTKITFDAGPTTVAVGDAGSVAGPLVITLGPDKSPPHLKVVSTPARGKKVKKGDQITLDITSEEVRDGESWQEGVQDIQLTANGTLIDSKDYSDQRGKWCDAKSWKQTWKKVYTVPSGAPPLITLCVSTEDFVGNTRKLCGDYPTGDHWTGTIHSTSSADYKKGGSCVNEKWLFNLDVYVVPDGTVAGKGTGTLTSSPECHLNGNGQIEQQMHNIAFDVSGTLNGQNFQLFFSDTSRDGKTYGLMDFALLNGTPIASDMPPFIFSIQGPGSAGGIVSIAYSPAFAGGTVSVNAQHIVDIKCLDCSKP